MSSLRNLRRAFSAAIFPIVLCFACGVAAATIEPGRTPVAKMFVNRKPSQLEVNRTNTGAKYEPFYGCYLGAFIDFDPSLKLPFADSNRTVHQDPAGFENIVGKQHAMYFFYLGYGRPLASDWVRVLAARNKFVHIALEPNEGLDKVQDDAYLQKLADDMAQTGAKIFLRFASEMNGDWTNYHKDPALYREKFRLVHDVMARRAPNVALVWCPYMEPIFNIGDYYPGDDAVDWVGVNLYNVTYHNNSLSEPAENEHPVDLLKYVYYKYSKTKPIMICEYAASHYAACEGRPRPDFAMRKILDLYTALPRMFPRVKCINYFDSNNLQFVAERAYNDYSVTDDPMVNAAYRHAIMSPYFLSEPQAPGPRRVPLPVVAMPVRPYEKFRRSVWLSCWARTPSDFVTVRYLVDGYPIYRASRPDQWECIWNASSMRPGPHILSLETIDPAGLVVAKQSVPIAIVP